MAIIFAVLIEVVVSVVSFMLLPWGDPTGLASGRPALLTFLGGTAFACFIGWTHWHSLSIGW